MHVICISGERGSGRYTAANFIADELRDIYEKRVAILYYRDLIGYIRKMYFDWDDAFMSRYKKRVQKFAEASTDELRKTKPYFWISFIAGFFELLGDDLDFIIIPDCMYENEIEVFRDYGFGVTSIVVKKGESDFSFIENYDISVLNDRTLKDLEEICDAITGVIVNLDSMGEFTCQNSELIKKKPTKQQKSSDMTKNT